METSEDQIEKAKEAFGGLFKFLTWLRENAIAISVSGVFFGGGAVGLERFHRHEPATSDQTSAVLSNNVKEINKTDTLKMRIDSLSQIASVLVGAAANSQIRLSMLDTKIDNLSSDLMKAIPSIRVIDQRRQDSIYRANRPAPFLGSNP